MRNSATVTSRRSSTSRCSSRAERARVERRGRAGSFALRDLEQLGIFEREVDVRVSREQAAAAEAGIEQPVGDARRTSAAPAKRIGQLAEPRFELRCLSLGRERVAPRLEVLQKWLRVFPAPRASGR